MTQEDRELLLKDLSSRVPYGVKYMKYSWGYGLDQEIPEVEVLECVDKNGYISHTKVYKIDDIKPYLFPLSSMTEEQKKEYNFWKHEVPVFHYEYGDVVEEVELFDSPESFEYLIENHFDYRGLIEKGLALDATNKNIY